MKSSVEMNLRSRALAVRVGVGEWTSVETFRVSRIVGSLLLTNGLVGVEDLFFLFSIILLLLWRIRFL